MTPFPAWLRAQFTLTAVLSWLPIAIVVGAGAAVSFTLNKNLRTDRDLVVHSHQVIEAGQRLLIAAADAETGQRGYLVTGDKTYLEPFENGRKAARAALDRLTALISDNATQRERVTRIDALMREKDAELREAIAAREKGGFEAARAFVVTNRGKAIMDEVRTVLGDLNGTEDDILRAREAAVSRAEWRVIMAGIFVGLASIVTRIALAWMSSRHKSGIRS